MTGSALLEHKPVVKPKPPPIKLSEIYKQNMQKKGFQYHPSLGWHDPNRRAY